MTTPTLPHGLDRDLNEEELEDLEDVLSMTDFELAMDLPTLEGFFTAIAISPSLVMPSEWLGWVWDMEEGQTKPEFASEEEASSAMNLIMRYYNSLVRQFMTDPEGFEPLYVKEGDWTVYSWCEGFILGTQFGESDWHDAMSIHPEYFTPLMLLLEASESNGSEEDELREQEFCITELLPAILKIHAYFKTHGPQRIPGIREEDFHFAHGPTPPRVRTTPKVGRNDPCPCGSGKKYKKCCGANGPTLH